MSIKFDAWEPYYFSGAGVPVYNAWSMCAWCKLNATIDWSAILLITDTSNYMQLYVGDSSLYLGLQGSGTTEWTNPISGTGVWFFVAISNSGSTAGTFKGYYAYPNSTSFQTNTETGVNITGTRYLYIGGNDYSPEDPRCSLQFVKVWDAVLTEAEFWQEMHSGKPVRLANLNSFYPWFDLTNATTDFSGNGHTLTLASGSPSADEPPPVGWGVTESGLYVPAGGLWEPSDNSWAEVKLESGSDPSTDDNFKVYYTRYRDGTGTINFAYALVQGSTVIEEWTDLDIPASATTASHTITNASAISDFTDLRIRWKAYT